MAKPLKEWIEDDVSPFRDRSNRWLLENHFFRDSSRPLVSDLSYFFASADGIVLYPRRVEPYRRIRNPSYDRESQFNLPKTKGERNEQLEKAETLHDRQHPSVRLGPVWIGACSRK